MKGQVIALAYSGLSKGAARLRPYALCADQSTGPACLRYLL